MITLKSNKIKWDLCKISPIYINTLNIFRPLKTWFKNKIKNHKLKFPNINIKCKLSNFDWIRENIYTWYWWEHEDIWDFKHKLILIIIDDVQYKYTYGIKMLESIPFIIIKIFNFNMIIKFKAPKYFDDYQYYESLRSI